MMIAEPGLAGGLGGGAPPARDEAFARIRLLRSPNIGPVTYTQLLRRFGSGARALEALPDLAARGGGAYRIAAERAISDEIGAVRRAGARYLFHDMADYPALLRAAENAPPILIARGDGALLAREAVALVGARNASAGAVRLARDFARRLAGHGLSVVSGLARGIDAAAHEGALSAGGAEGRTIAVIAGGIDVAYPPENAELQARIAAEGLLLTEMPPGVEPQARHFPARNRIIAGLGAGTLVVEAALKSGSLITARLAAELGREVMAVPGSPLDPRSHGCNQLIRDGAALVQSAEDVIELLETAGGAGRRLRDGGGSWQAPPDEATAEATQPLDIAALLNSAPVAVDELIRQTGAPAAAVHMALIELELAGRLERHAGARVSLSG